MVAGASMKIRTALWMWSAAALVVAAISAGDAAPQLLWTFDTGG